MINWLKKKIIKSIIDDVVKKLPVLKERVDGWWDANHDEIFQEIKQKIKELVRSKCG